MTGWAWVVLAVGVVAVLLAVLDRPRPDPPHDGRWRE